MWPACFFFQAEDGIRDSSVTGVQTCALPILPWSDVVQHAQYFDLEFFDLAAGKHGFADTPLPRAHLREREYRGLREKIRCYNQGNDQAQDGHKLILASFDPEPGTEVGEGASARNRKAWQRTPTACQAKIRDRRKRLCCHRRRWRGSASC